MKITELELRLRQERLRRGITQEEAAEQVHLSVYQYARAESGATDLNGGMIGRYAKFLNTDSKSAWRMMLSSMEVPDTLRKDCAGLLFRRRRAESKAAEKTKVSRREMTARELLAVREDKTFAVCCPMPENEGDTVLRYTIRLLQPVFTGRDREAVLRAVGRIRKNALRGLPADAGFYRQAAILRVNDDSGVYYWDNAKLLERLCLADSMGLDPVMWSMDAAYDIAPLGENDIYAVSRRGQNETYFIRSGDTFLAVTGLTNLPRTEEDG